MYARIGLHKDCSSGSIDVGPISLSCYSPAAIANLTTIFVELVATKTGLCDECRIEETPNELTLLIRKSCDLAHETRVVISAIKHNVVWIYVCMYVFYGAYNCSGFVLRMLKCRSMTDCAPRFWKQHEGKISYWNYRNFFKISLPENY